MKDGSVKITIVVDNQAGPGLMVEHGFSLLVESGRQRILFDTGQGEALPANMNAMGLDPGRLDRLVLSHGHYDHTGGLPWILKNSGPVDLYCHPDVTRPRYSKRPNGSTPIQMPHDATAAIGNVPAHRMHWVLEQVQLGGGIGLTGPVPRLTDYEDVGGDFFLDFECRRPDPISDDLALWITTVQGIVVCVGCCHSGLINTLHHVRHLCGGSPIAAVIGGFHLLNANTNRLRRTMAALQTVAPKLVVPCHCTGRHAVSILRRELGQRVEPGVSGTSYQF